MEKDKSCCTAQPTERQKKGADHSNVLARVSRVKGQIEGIGRMIEGSEYCPKIITQIQAARSALASLQAVVLKAHLEHCVKQGLAKGGRKETDELVQELIAIFKHVE